MAKPLTRRASSGKGLVCGIGIYEPRVLCMTDAPHLPRVHGIWRGMLLRTTEMRVVSRPSYAGTSVAPAFHRFADFAEWAVRQIGWDGEGYHLDKDLLENGNRVYSPDTCVFLPAVINTQLSKSPHRESGLPAGVMQERSGRFSARLKIEKKHDHLGMFDNPEDAYAAYKIAKAARFSHLAVMYQGRIDQRAFDALMARAAILQSTDKTAEK